MPDHSIPHCSTLRATKARLRRGTLLLVALQAGCVTQPPPPPPLPIPVVEAPQPEAPSGPSILETQTGLASYYHPSLHGLETASGIPFDNEAFMAAHPTYPLGTIVHVTNLGNGETVVEVTITDRGPTEENVVEGVIIDLSGAIAERLDMIEDGRIEVRVDVVQWGENR